MAVRHLRWLVMLHGRWAAPVPDPVRRGSLPLGGLSPSHPLIIDVLHGDVHVQRVAADLTESGRPPRWVRLAAYDLDRPALDALAAAIANGTAGTAAGSPVVVESDDRRQAESFLSRLASIEPAEPTPCAVVLHYVRPGADRGRVTPTRGPATRPIGPGDAALQRLTGGRWALHDSVFEAGRRLRPGELADIVERSRGLDELTTRLTARLLQHVPTRTRTLLDLVALLGYCHPRFASLEPVLDACDHLPWWTDLTGGWRRFDPAWRDAVHAVCRSDRRPQVPLLGRLVSDIADDGAHDAAIELCLDAGYPGTASDLLAGIGPDLLAAGRPLAVRRWIRRLPRSGRRRHRMLAVQLRAARRTSGEAVGPTGGRGRPRHATQPTHGPPRSVGVSPLALQVRLLGTVDVAIGGRQVRHWHGRKGTTLLAYLLMHDGRPIPRDSLAVTFWPDAPPDASRNRLHVALHTLRGDLQAASPVPVVVFQHGYQLNPELDIRLDTQEFERAAARGERAEREDINVALAAYQDAVREYRGDLLSDHPYEDWTLLPREHYRVRMLDVLGRAAQLAFDAGRYPESVQAGQRLLALDFCREDLHRLLMRAYTRLGRPHLALHQFEICSRQLRQELDMAPARETVELHTRIRARLAI
jgi:DNA-binding SARP family transcriptional activator